MAAATNALISQYYSSDHHPYRVLEREAMKYVKPQSVLLNAGCGHAAPLLFNLAPYVDRSIGVDVCASHPPESSTYRATWRTPDCRTHPWTSWWPVRFSSTRARCRFS